MFAAQHVGVEFATSIVRFPVMAYSAAMVLLMFKLHNRTWPRVFAVLGQYTFGIFFIHMFLLRVLDKELQRIHWLYLCQPIYQFLMIGLVLGLCWLAITSVRRVIGKDRASKYLGF
jgi:fucose 4-O-acetylase-like acetyltransferase